MTRVRTVGDFGEEFDFIAFGLGINLFDLVHGLEHLKEEAKGKPTTPGEGALGSEELAGAVWGWGNTCLDVIL